MDCRPLIDSPEDVKVCDKESLAEPFRLIEDPPGQRVFHPEREALLPVLRQIGPETLLLYGPDLLKGNHRGLSLSVRKLKTGPQLPEAAGISQGESMEPGRKRLGCAEVSA